MGSRQSSIILTIKLPPFVDVTKTCTGYAYLNDFNISFLYPRVREKPCLLGMLGKKNLPSVRKAPSSLPVYIFLLS